MGSLVDIDLPKNPGKYIASSVRVTDDGSVIVLVQNKTPRNVGNVQVKIIYPDANGRTRELVRGAPGILDAGKTGQIPTGLKVTSSAQARNIKAGVVRAAVTNR